MCPPFPCPLPPRAADDLEHVLLEQALFVCSERILSPAEAGKREALQARHSGPAPAAAQQGGGGEEGATDQVVWGAFPAPLHGPPPASALLQAELRSLGSAMRQLRPESVRTCALIAWVSGQGALAPEALAAAREGLRLLEAQGGREPYHAALCCRAAALGLCTLGPSTRVPAGEVVALLERAQRAESAASTWLPPMLRNWLDDMGRSMPFSERELRAAAASGQVLHGVHYAQAPGEGGGGGDASMAALLGSLLGGGSGAFGPPAPPGSMDNLMQRVAGALNDASGGSAGGGAGFGGPLGLLAAMDSFRRSQGQGPGAAPRSPPAGSPATPQQGPAAAGTAAQASLPPPRSSEPAGGAFLQERLARCEAIPPAQRSPDVAGFVAGYRLVDEVVAALPPLEAVAAGAPAVPHDAADLAMLRTFVAQHVSAGGVVHPGAFKSRLLRQAGPDLVEMGSATARDASGWTRFSVRRAHAHGCPRRRRRSQYGCLPRTQQACLTRACPLSTH